MSNQVRRCMSPPSGSSPYTKRSNYAQIRRCNPGRFRLSRTDPFIESLIVELIPAKTLTKALFHHAPRFARSCSILYILPIASTRDTSSLANSCNVKIKLSRYVSEVIDTSESQNLTNRLRIPVRSRSQVASNSLQLTEPSTPVNGFQKFPSYKVA
jgi:hypothetical protein